MCELGLQGMRRVCGSWNLAGRFGSSVSSLTGGVTPGKSLRVCMPVLAAAVSGITNNTCFLGLGQGLSKEMSVREEGFG